MEVQVLSPGIASEVLPKTAFGLYIKWMNGCVPPELRRRTESKTIFSLPESLPTARIRSGGRVQSKNPMNQNLDQLRQNYCRPGVVATKGVNCLFPLEKECDQGRSILASAPKTFLQLQEFSPYGLHQTYRDEATDLELPVFVVFNLEGNHQLSFEITTDSIAPTTEPKSLPSYIPFQKTQASVREINKRRDRGERAAGRVSLILGIVPVLAYFFSGLDPFPAFMEAGILIGGWLLGSFLTYVFCLSMLNRFLPWKKLIVTAEFDGILPKETRQKALIAKNYFDHLYVIVDQQRRWKSSLLPDPRPRALDPLLIGEVKQGNARKFFLLDQFDLTPAEQYLADEFASVDCI
jgi:hypothetical protein